MADGKLFDNEKVNKAMDDAIKAIDAASKTADKLNKAIAKAEAELALFFAAIRRFEEKKDGDLSK